MSKEFKKGSHRTPENIRVLKYRTRELEGRLAELYFQRGKIDNRIKVLEIKKDNQTRMYMDQEQKAYSDLREYEAKRKQLIQEIEDNETKIKEQEKILSKKKAQVEKKKKDVVPDDVPGDKPIQ